MDNESLVLDLVEWVAADTRTYDQVMAAWRTSCPRLTIWEDCIDHGLLRLDGRIVTVTDEGRRFINQHHSRAGSGPPPGSRPTAASRSDTRR